MKRIVTIQDISGVGKCSVTVAHPVISAMGVECAVMPTAVLSTHTMFSGYTFLDLTDQMQPIADHWKKEGIGFDAIYTGYLGSFEQLHIVGRFIDDFRTPDNVVIIDPVMGDNGKLYPGFTTEFAHEMGELIARADLALPNLTEACFMLDIPYREDFTEEEIKDILRRLCALGAKRAALKGIAFRPGKTGVMLYDSEKDTFSAYEHDRVPVSFHGTGDLFASVVTGGLMRGLTEAQALRLAADYTALTIAETVADPDHRNYGVNFEATIPALVTRLQAELAH